MKQIPDQSTLSTKPMESTNHAQTSIAFSSTGQLLSGVMAVIFRLRVSSEALINTSLLVESDHPTRTGQGLNVFTRSPLTGKIDWQKHRATSVIHITSIALRS